MIRVIKGLGNLITIYVAADSVKELRRWAKSRRWPCYSGDAMWGRMKILLSDRVTVARVRGDAALSLKKACGGLSRATVKELGLEWVGWAKEE